jgi:hypothetical protein
MRKMFRRIAAALVVGALALSVVAVASGAGTGMFEVIADNLGAQQGSVIITGACQNGETVNVSFNSEWNVPESNFQHTSVSLTGINAACTGGVLVVNATAPGTPFAVTPGTVTVALNPTVMVGDLEDATILLTN